VKYVMHSPGGLVWTSIEHTHAEQCNYASMISISKPFVSTKSLQSIADSSFSIFHLSDTFQRNSFQTAS